MHSFHSKKPKTMRFVHVLQFCVITVGLGATIATSSVAAGVMGGGDWSYRAQWWVRHTKGREAFAAIGVNGQWIYLDVDRKQVR